jgi:hypothetical protein
MASDSGALVPSSGSDMVNFGVVIDDGDGSFRVDSWYDRCFTWEAVQLLLVLVSRCGVPDLFTCSEIFPAFKSICSLNLYGMRNLRAQGRGEVKEC